MITVLGCIHVAAYYHGCSWRILRFGATRYWTTLTRCSCLTYCSLRISFETTPGLHLLTKVTSNTLCSLHISVDRSLGPFLDGVTLPALHHLEINYLNVAERDTIWPLAGKLLAFMARSSYPLEILKVEGSIITAADLRDNQAMTMDGLIVWMFLGIWFRFDSRLSCSSPTVLLIGMWVFPFEAFPSNSSLASAS